jgi:hypothetical protein
MIDQDHGTEPVECAEIIYRALKRAWTPDEVIPPEAFIRRIRKIEMTAEEAVSCFRRKYVTARECRSRLKRMLGSASLHVGLLRDLPSSFDVSPDPGRDDQGTVFDPGHCLILNLPDPVMDSEAAEFAASQLIKIARYITPDQEEREQRERTSNI